MAKELAKAWATKKNRKVAENNDQQQRTKEECIYRDKQGIEAELSRDRGKLRRMSETLIHLYMVMRDWF